MYTVVEASVGFTDSDGVNTAAAAPAPPAAATAAAIVAPPLGPPSLPVPLLPVSEIAGIFFALG